MKKLFQLIVLTICISAEAQQPPALYNFGATCYLNSTVQALYNCQAVTDTLIANNFAYPENSLSDLYVKLITAMRNPQGLNPIFDKKLPELGVIEPDGKPLNNFVAKAWQVMGGSGQMDATHFITTLLSDLTDQGQNTQNLRDLFSIGQASTLRCPLQTAQGDKIDFERTRIEEETTINVQAEGFSTLKECLDSYFATEVLDDEDNYYWLDLNQEELVKDARLAQFNKQKIPNCSKGLALFHLSDFVIVTLKRFAFDPQTLASHKLDHDVDVPTLVKFGDYMLNPNAQATPPTYELIGAIMHSGSLQFGHYIAYVKVGNQWYGCNDFFVQAMTWAEMVNPTHVLFKDFAINKSYALVYKKLTPQEAQLAQALEELREEEERIAQEQERLRKEKEQEEEEERKRKEQEEERKRKEAEERKRKEQEEGMAREQERLFKEEEEKQRKRKENLTISLRGLSEALDGLYAKLSS